MDGRKRKQSFKNYAKLTKTRKFSQNDLEGVYKKALNKRKVEKKTSKTMETASKPLFESQNG